MTEPEYVFSPEAWANIVLMAEDGHDPDNPGATLIEAMRRHPLGCQCPNEGCIAAKSR